MKLIFRADRYRTEYWSQDYHLVDGDVVDVPPAIAQKFLKFFPANFIDLAPKPFPKLKATPLVSILIPQRGRPAYIKKCLELILKNTSYPEYEVILICDRDDMDSIKDIPEDNRIKVVTDPSPTRQMFAGKINYGFSISKGDYIVYLANDVEVEKNWLTEAMKAMSFVFADGIGLVAFNLGDGREHAFHGLISRKFVDRYLAGNIFYPDYVHFWCDIELLNVARKFKKFYLCPTSKVVHTSPKDALHDEAWERTYGSGHNIFEDRQRMGFPPGKPRKIFDISIVTLHHWTEEILKKDLLSYLPPGAEYIQFDNRGNRLFSSAAQGFNHGIRKARNDVVMCVHEDTMFKKEWFENFVKQENELKNWGAIGIVGVGFDSPWHHWGWKSKAPCLATTLDECCIVINKKNNIWFDEKNFDEWHGYGVDFCLQARNEGLDIYIMNGPAFHDDTQKAYSLPEGWRERLVHYKKVLRKKWGDKFPTIQTTTGPC